tara:strand:+ start:654 stop:797 length:144 start_codon:yes stop_codon:yes gene_type:complete
VDSPKEYGAKESDFRKYKLVPLKIIMLGRWVNFIVVIKRNQAKLDEL